VDTNIGFVPFSVNFNATSKIPVDSWSWTFGDGGTDIVQNPSFIYNAPGVYDVNLEINSGGNIFNRLKENYIIAIADTVIGSENTAGIDSTVIFTINATNNIPLKKFDIPVEYDGTLPLQFDSISTDGCRTEYFDYIGFSHFDSFLKRLTITIENTKVYLPVLDPGSGPILKIFFTIKSQALPNDTTVINLDGYVNGPTEYLPTFSQGNISYNPAIEPGFISSIFISCCVGIRGNINNDNIDEIAIDDLVYYVEYQFDLPPGPEPECFEEADVNADGGLDIEDLVNLVSYMFDLPPGPPPLDCPGI
jgi:PKD repeat protein